MRTGFLTGFGFEPVASCGYCKRRGNAGSVEWTNMTSDRMKDSLKPLHVVDDFVGQEWPESGRDAGHAGNA